jgi:hypothetical protein
MVSMINRRECTGGRPPNRRLGRHGSSGSITAHWTSVNDES